jgi:hypothetical protein
MWFCSRPRGEPLLSRVLVSVVGQLYLLSVHSEDQNVAISCRHPNHEVEQEPLLGTTLAAKRLQLILPNSHQVLVVEVVAMSLLPSGGGDLPLCAGDGFV